MIRTKTYTASLKKQTHVNLMYFLFQQKELYNAALQERIDCYDKTGKSLTNYDQRNSYTQIREELPEYEIFDSFAQRTIFDRLETSFKNFFRRLKAGEKPGFPRFKKYIRSFETSQFTIKDKGQWNSVTIKGIGELRFKGKTPEDIKRIRVVCTPLRMKIQVIYELPDTNIVDNRLPVGIDRGINKLIVTSNGKYVNGKNLDRSRLKKKQAKLSKAKPGSNNRKKKKLAYKKEWQRTTERENGFIHEITTELIKNTSSMFFLEDIKINNMVKNKHLAKKILEQKWGYFEVVLTYKAESAGGWVIKVNPKYTSRTCSECGVVDKEFNDQVFTCDHCGHEQDRDLNAANVILQRGTTYYSLQSGGEWNINNGIIPETCGVYTNYDLSLAPAKQVEYVEQQGKGYIKSYDFEATYCKPENRFFSFCATK